jgi:hypothetical protein
VIAGPDPTSFAASAARLGSFPLSTVAARKEKGSVRYPVEAAATRYGAGVERATASPAEAYARFGDPERGRDPDIF